MKEEKHLGKMKVADKRRIDREPPKFGNKKKNPKSREAKWREARRAYFDSLRTSDVNSHRYRHYYVSIAPVVDDAIRDAVVKSSYEHCSMCYHEIYHHFDGWCFECHHECEHANIRSIHKLHGVFPKETR